MKKDDSMDFALKEWGQLHNVWLDETGEMPDLTAWPDETGELPAAAEWLDETGELPAAAEWPEETGELPAAAEWLDETGELPAAAEWLDETGELPAAAEWLDETGELPAAAEWPDETGKLPGAGECRKETQEPVHAGTWPEETQELPVVARYAARAGEEEPAAFTEEEGSENPVEPENAENLVEPEDPDEPEDAEDSAKDPARFEEPACGKVIPRLHLKDWDDTLDEEPEGWFETGRVRRPHAEDMRTAAIRDVSELPEEGPDVPYESENPELPETPYEPELSEPPYAPARVWRRLWNGLEEKRAFTAAAAGLGVLIVIAVASAGVTAAGNRELQQQRESLAAVGDLLPGDQVLNTDAVNRLAELRIQKEEEEAAARKAAQEKAAREAEQDEAEGSVAVNFTLSTIQSDLKIKIRREKEQSLIGGVPFTVKIKGPNGKTTEQTDEDEDGIIYLTGLANGKYEVKLCSLIDLDEIKQEEDYRENEDYVRYSRYSLSDAAQTIAVTDHIAYEVVDVSDEVKSASEVNAAKEDTARNDTPVESTIKDTVEWVESTKTEITDEGGEAAYTEVSKKDVPDPYASAVLPAASFRRLSEVSAGDSTDSKENTADGTSAEEGTGGETAGDNTGEKETTNDGNADGGSDSTGDGKEAENPQLKVDPSEIHLTVGGTQSVKATVTGAADTTVSYTSSDTEIATVSDGGTVQGVKAGSCTVTVSLREYAEVTQTVSVTVSEKTDDSTPLKDADGNPLYVKENESYRAATAGDYNSHDVFYRKNVTEKKYRYTGWQHINGLTYFYDKNGTPVTGAQIIQGVSYTFSSEGILDTGSTNAGIDVSMWNGSIRWSEVAASGISFAIVRCGYRGSSTGALVKDSTVGTNVTGARNAGLKVGLYFFSQAVNEAEAVEEASMAVQIARSYGISMPIFLDVESSGGRGDAVSVSQRTANIAAFCKTVQNAGFSAGVYANTNWFSEKINVSALTGYHIWLAQYAETPTYSGSRYDIWQYSSTGHVNGISGNVDLNISYRAF